MRHSKTKKYIKRNKSKNLYKKKLTRKRLRKGGGQKSYVSRKVDFNWNLTDKKGTGMRITGVTRTTPPN